MNPRTTCAPKC